MKCLRERVSERQGDERDGSGRLGKRKERKSEFFNLVQVHKKSD